MSVVVLEDPAWQAIMADPALARARSRLSFDDIRQIVKHAQAATDKANAPASLAGLKPCPFCRGEAKAGETLDSRWYVLCSNCETMSGSQFVCKEAAIEAWNRRA